jgi:hypothetical protein
MVVGVNVIMASVENAAITKVKVTVNVAHLEMVKRVNNPTDLDVRKENSIVAIRQIGKIYCFSHPFSRFVRTYI